MVVNSLDLGSHYKQPTVTFRSWETWFTAEGPVDVDDDTEIVQDQKVRTMLVLIRCQNPHQSRDMFIL